MATSSANNDKMLEMSEAEELEGLIEKLVTSGEMTLDKARMKKLKSVCKRSDKSLRHVFHLLFMQLHVEHSQVRYSVFQIVDQLFNRSHLFRTLLLDKFQEYMDLTIETDFDNPLPPPKSNADKLKQEALLAIRDWHSKYGIAYHKLSFGFDYLKNTKKVNFEQAQPQSRNIAVEQRLQRQKIVNGVKLDKLQKELDSSLWEVKCSVVELNNCLELIVPMFDESKDLPESSSMKTEEESTDRDVKTGTDIPDSSSLRETGLPERGYVVQLDLAEVSSVNVSQTADNKAVLDRVRDCVKSVNRIHVPRIRAWLTTAGKCGAPSELVKELIDVKESLQGALDKYHDLNISNHDECDSDDDFSEFVEVPEDFCPKITQKNKKILPEKTKPVKKSSKIKSDTNIWTPLRQDDDLLDPTTYKYALAKQEKLRKAKMRNAETSPKPLKKVFLKPKKAAGTQDESSGSSIKEKAPFVSFGHDLLTWDKAKYKELKENLSLGAPKEYDVSHRFYGTHSASEGDSGVSDAALSSVMSRTIEFSGEFKPVTHSCRAPLPNGKLCPRQDRYKCPFHGKIIPRDATGKPAVGKDLPSSSSQQTNDWQDPEFLRDLESNIAGEVNLSYKKKGKRKKPENGLTDLKKMKDTSRSRLQQKVLNRGSLKRVSETLNDLDAKRNFDKFGNNFNYALQK